MIYVDLSDHFPINNINKNINKAAVLSGREKKNICAVVTDLNNSIDAQTAFAFFTASSQ